MFCINWGGKFMVRHLSGIMNELNEAMDDLRQGFNANSFVE